MFHITELLTRNVLPDCTLTGSMRNCLFYHTLPSTEWCFFFPFLSLLILQTKKIHILNLMSNTVVIMNSDFKKYVYFSFTFHDLWIIYSYLCPFAFQDLFLESFLSQITDPTMALKNWDKLFWSNKTFGRRQLPGSLLV